MNCRHKRIDWLEHSIAWGQLEWWRTGNRRRHQAAVCLDCGSWLPLGPANDDSEAVQVEIRAAALAGAYRTEPTPMECRGWQREESINLTAVFPDKTAVRKQGVPLNLDHVEWRAGYLARCIAEHDDQDTRAVGAGEREG